MSRADFAIDLVSGDRLVENGQFVRATGRRAVAQWVWARLNTRRREWRLNPRYGWDIELMMRKPTQRALIEADLRVLISTVPGVLGISEFTLDFNFQTRVMTLEATVLVEGQGALAFTATSTTEGGWLLLLEMI